MPTSYDLEGNPVYPAPQVLPDLPVLGPQVFIGVSSSGDGVPEPNSGLADEEADDALDLALTEIAAKHVLIGAETDIDLPASTAQGEGQEVVSSTTIDLNWERPDSGDEDNHQITGWKSIESGTITPSSGMVVHEGAPGVGSNVATENSLSASTAQGEGQEPVAQIDHLSGLDPTDQLLQLIIGDAQSEADGSGSNHVPGNSAVDNEVEFDSEGTGAGIEDSLSLEDVLPQHLIIDGQKFSVSPKKPNLSVDMGPPLTEDITIIPKGYIPSDGEAPDVTADAVTSLGALEANNLTGSQDLLDLGVELFA